MFLIDNMPDFFKYRNLLGRHQAIVTDRQIDMYYSTVER